MRTRGRCSFTLMYMHTNIHHTCAYSVADYRALQYHVYEHACMQAPLMPRAPDMIPPWSLGHGFGSAVNGDANAMGFDLDPDGSYVEDQVTTPRRKNEEEQVPLFTPAVRACYSHLLLTLPASLLHSHACSVHPQASVSHLLFTGAAATPAAPAPPTAAASSIRTWHLPCKVTASGASAAFWSTPYVAGLSTARPAAAADAATAFHAGSSK